jgi:dolichyl-phosphate beta-glucosyltransferase
MDSPKLSVVIPAYNEENRLTETLEIIIQYLSVQEYPWEIIIVDDGSKDKTAEVAESMSCPNLRVIKHNPNQGKGAAVKTGMLAAVGQYRLFCDSDNATPFEEIEKLWPVIDEKTVVIGSRYMKGSQIVIEQTFLRRLLSRLGNILIQIILLPGLPDTQCGFKMFTAEAAERIFSRQTISRWGFDMEILYLARKLGYKVRQVPVNWYDRAGSKVQSSKVFLKTFSELFRIRWNSLVGKYR